MSPLTVNRRLFLGAGLGGAALVATGSLAGCSSGSTGGGSGSTAANSGVELPTYIRFEGVTADIPGTEDGIPDTFFSYPANPTSAISQAPGDGTAISGSVPIGTPVPPSMDRNAYWQELNERIGSDLNLTITPRADFSQRFATAVAGTGLGDLFTLDTNMAQLPQFLEAQCQDLTEYLSGDAIADYPFLANLATESWRGTVFNGGIYTIPITRGVQSSVLFCTRADLFEELGIEPDPSTVDDFVQACRVVTDARANRWALTGTPMTILQQMFGLPNTWQEEGGAFTHAHELDGYKDALELGRMLVEEELVHPDGVTATGTDQVLWFGAGSAVMHGNTYSGIASMHQANAGGLDSYAVGLMQTPSEDGSAAPFWLGAPNNTLSAIKKSDPDRVRTLLAVLNWLAAPLGTEEHLFRKYGVEGVHYELNGTDPVLTPVGESETSLGYFPIEYLVDGPRINYFPGRPDIAEDVRAHMEVAVPTGISNPTVGLYSETQGMKGGQLGTVLTDATNEILLGRAPVSSWDAAVEKWRSDGGDTIRSEYEEAFDAANG